MEQFEVNFGRQNQASFFFHKTKDTITVRTHSGNTIVHEMEKDAEPCRQILRLPDLGIEVYKVSEASFLRHQENLQKLADVDYAAATLVDAKAGVPAIYSDRLFIKFIDALSTADCERLLQSARLKMAHAASYARNAYFVTVPADTGKQIFRIALDLLAQPNVEYCHPELIRERKHRTIHPNQWHLKATTVTYQVEIDQSANVEKAHRISMGIGTVIAVIDDGVDLEHPEFNRIGKIVAPRSYRGEPNHNPRPKSTSDDHGTACAGVACADGLYGASGVAPKAQLMPIQMGDGDQAEADAFVWAADRGADVISCSWGPPDGTGENFPLPASTRLAFDYAVEKGRKGKGCVILFAAGNGNESVDDDGYASYARVIAVAACNDRGKRSVYSDFGKAVWCCFPSDDLPEARPLTRGIWSTDLRSIDGSNPGRLSDGDHFGNYTDSFGGTSSATPGAAGVVALVLSVNPALKWNEVRDILKSSCDKIDSDYMQIDKDDLTDADKKELEIRKYDKDGHSQAYGYGRINAEKAVLLALQMKNALAPKPETAPSVPA